MSYYTSSKHMYINEMGSLALGSSRTSSQMARPPTQSHKQYARPTPFTSNPIVRPPISTPGFNPIFQAPMNQIELSNNINKALASLTPLDDLMHLRERIISSSQQSNQNLVEMLATANECLKRILLSKSTRVESIIKVSDVQVGQEEEKENKENEDNQTKDERPSTPHPPSQTVDEKESITLDEEVIALETEKLINDIVSQVEKENENITHEIVTKENKTDTISTTTITPPPRTTTPIRFHPRPSIQKKIVQKENSSVEESKQS